MDALERVKQLMKEEGMAGDEITAMNYAIIYIKAQQDLLKEQLERSK